MHWYLVLAVIGAGIVSGFMNTLAGSGSLITLPLLMMCGLPANIANGTNRIAILLQNLVGVTVFSKQKIINYKTDIWLAVPVVAGSLLGAGLAVRLNNNVIEKAIGGVMVLMFFLILLKPEVWIKGRSEKVKGVPTVLQYSILFLVGIYGGFIQAGVGLFMLAALVLASGYDLVKANALKLLFVLLYTPFALVIFMIDGQINYSWGLFLSAGNMVGAYIASKMALERGAGFIRIVLLVVIMIAALDLTGVLKWVIGMIRAQVLFAV